MTTRSPFDAAEHKLAQRIISVGRAPVARPSPCQLLHRREIDRIDERAQAPELRFDFARRGIEPSFRKASGRRQLYY